MRAPGRSPLTAKAVATVMLAGGLVAVAPAGVASAASCPVGEGAGRPALSGVAATSSSNAWAVGAHPGTSTIQNLIEHWNGTGWKVQSSPDEGGSTALNSLSGVAATSSSNAWAVGSYRNGTSSQTLIEHRNSTAWTIQASPDPGGSTNNNYLVGVAATSSSNAWAVGSFSNGTASQTLIEHWNGTAWRVKTSPNPGGSANDNELDGVVATSSSNAWAVGSYSNGTARQTLIEHWNGTAWKHVSSPNPGGSGNDNWLSGVAVAASSNAWAVGSYWNGSAYVSLIEHWNGTAWRVKTSGNPSSSLNDLAQVAATSSSNAWAVGTYCNGTALQTLIEHWNGTAWRVQASSNPGGSADDNYLAAVAATSASNAWAVGQYNNGTTYGTLIEHWNGTAWKHVTSP